MNDINAVKVSSRGVNIQTAEERLAKLSELKDKNLISEEEYEKRRQKILDEI